MTDLAKLVSVEESLARMEAEARAKMAPAGALGLPPLVDRRRLEFLIPDGAFQHVAMYDRILVAQLPDKPQDKYIEGGLIVKSQRQAAKELMEAPRGIIISAGLKALDNLKSNGCDVGHIVRFIRNAPYRYEVDQIGGRSIPVMLLRDGDIVSSEDLHLAIKAGKVHIKVVETSVPDNLGGNITVRSHVYVDSSGVAWNPEHPFISDDM